jgi:hypothetical protein
MVPPSCRPVEGVVTGDATVEISGGDVQIATG